LIQLRWEGADSNLHRVWDSEIISNRVDSIDGVSRDPSVKYAQWLLNTYHDEALQVSHGEPGTAAAWYQSSLSYLSTAYDQTYQSEPGQYMKSALPIIDRRILEGGLHLAALLNQIYAKSSQVETPNQELILFAEKIVGSLEKIISLKPKSSAAGF
jgi:hypothetical protein